MENDQNDEQKRPDALHRAVHFLLQQQAVNNPDTTLTARKHMAKLDEIHARNVERETAEAEAATTAKPATKARTSARFSRKEKSAAASAATAADAKDE